MYTFACVTTETKLFFTQDANGILGLAYGVPSKNFEPIYETMYNAGLIEQQVFSLCLGKNGGYFQLGGFDGTDQIEEDVTWVKLSSHKDYIVDMKGIFINNHEIL